MGEPEEEGRYRCPRSGRCLPKAGRALRRLREREAEGRRNCGDHAELGGRRPTVRAAGCPAVFLSYALCQCAQHKLTQDPSHRARCTAVLVASNSFTSDITCVRPCEKMPWGSSRAALSVVRSFWRGKRRHFIDSSNFQDSQTLPKRYQKQLTGRQHGRQSTHQLSSP